MINGAYANVGGKWMGITSGYCNINGVWKPIYKRIYAATEIDHIEFRAARAVRGHLMTAYSASGTTISTTIGVYEIDPNTSRAANGYIEAELYVVAKDGTRIKLLASNRSQWEDVCNSLGAPLVFKVRATASYNNNSIWYYSVFLIEDWPAGINSYYTYDYYNSFATRTDYPKFIRIGGAAMSSGARVTTTMEINSVTMAGITIPIVVVDGFNGVKPNN